MTNYLNVIPRSLKETRLNGVPVERFSGENFVISCHSSISEKEFLKHSLWTRIGQTISW